MGIIFFLGFLTLAYMYMTQLIIPWYKNRNNFSGEILVKRHDFVTKEYAELSRGLNVLPVYASDFKTLHKGTELTVEINKKNPVLLLSKREDIRIYYPDNSVEFLSKKDNQWKRIPTSYSDVYEYAQKSHSIILENL